MSESRLLRPPWPVRPETLENHLYWPHYAQHAAESGVEIPNEPVAFLKAPSSICGPNDDVVIPRNSTMDRLGRGLAVIVETQAAYVSEDRTMDCIAGYCLFNDYSEREFQLERGGQWVKGKSFDTFPPLGPFDATPDEIRDPLTVCTCGSR